MLQKNYSSFLYFFIPSVKSSLSALMILYFCVFDLVVLGQLVLIYFMKKVDLF